MKHCQQEMTVIQNAWPVVCNFGWLIEADRNARKGKRYRAEVLNFTARLEDNLFTIQQGMMNGSYVLGPYRKLWVYVPKKRLVMALDYPDRIVQWSLYLYLNPLYDRLFIEDSYACRKDKGSHKAAKRLQYWMCQVQRKPGPGWYCLKLDISKYFYRVNHEKLLAILERRVKDPAMMAFIRGVVNSRAEPFGLPRWRTPQDTPPEEWLYEVGMPIGNLTSQLFANIYLNELDQYCKHRLKIHYYIRYMDDVIILGQDKETLHRWKAAVETFLQEELALDLNSKTSIRPVEIEKFKRKSVMKTYYQKAGIPTARWCVTADVTEAQAFAKTVGWPVIAKPDNGVGANGTHKFKNKTELNKFFQQEGPNVANYILEEFVDGEIVTFDGVADANAEPIYAASHVTPDSIMEIAHGKKPMWYYVAPEISPELRKMGEAALKAFGAKSRFFHLEFFRLKTAKPSLGNAGDILGLEVNMRPAGGYTVDMLNYAGGLDLYQIWADMVAFGAAHHPLARYHRYCCCAGRHDELRYRMPHEELLKKYRSCLNAAPRLPEVLAREMGDQLYIASFEDEAAMQAFRRDALARPRE